MALALVTVGNNTAGTLAGGILNGGSLSVDRSVISGNVAGSDGGGVYNQSTGSAVLVNTTISGNSSGGNGGAVLNLGTFTAANATIASNSAIAGGGVYNSAMATLRSTIVAGNSPENCAGAAAVTSSGYNLDDSASCGFAGAGDLSGVDPLLGPLADNGGPSSTHALLAGSPAVDAGSPSCPPPTTDQRGTARPQGARCDIGALERQTVSPLPTPTQLRLRGDTNCDGAVTSIDATLVLQYAAGLVLGLPCLEAADVNGDGLVNTVDSLLILQYDAGLLNSLPP